MGNQTKYGWIIGVLTWVQVHNIIPIIIIALDLFFNNGNYQSLSINNSQKFEVIQKEMIDYDMRLNRLEALTKAILENQARLGQVKGLKTVTNSARLKTGGEE